MRVARLRQCQKLKDFRRRCRSCRGALGEGVSGIALKGYKIKNLPFAVGERSISTEIRRGSKGVMLGIGQPLSVR